jgi:transcriptional regulator with XRE-family HTH domain
MEKEILGDKIKTLRNSKGYSQEHLSGLAQISLRTVQRIENGETEARGDTLNRLAKALEVGLDEFTPASEMRGGSYLAIMNLATLTYLIYPLFGIFIPFLLWLYKKDRSEYIYENGKKLIRFQFTMLVIVVSMIGVLAIPNLFDLTLPHWLDYKKEHVEIVGNILKYWVICNIIVTTINIVYAVQNKPLKYFPVFGFLLRWM